LDIYEIRSGINIIFTRFVDYPDIPFAFGILVREYLINLAFLQVLTVLVLYAQDKPIIFF